MNVKDIEARFSKATSEKSVWDSLYQSVFRMTMPNRDSFYIDENIPNNWENTALLTNVGCEAADGFAARFQRIICSDGQTVATLQAPDIKGFEDNVGQRQFDSNVSRSINKCLVPNLKNYLESAYDLVAGTTVCFRTFDKLNKRFYRIPIPIKDVALTKGFSGETDGYYRKLKIKREEIPYTWTELDPRNFKLNGVPTTDSNKDEEIELHESTIFNYEDGLWHYYVTCGEQLLVDRTSEYCDFGSDFWTRKPGSVYGIGVGVKALPELNQLNALRYYATFGLMFRAAPMWLVNQNHQLDYDRLEMKPMELIPVESTGKDNPSLTPLVLGDDPNTQQWNQAQMEMNIKAVMLAETIPNQTNEKMTATEIAARTNRLNTVSNNMVAVAQHMIEEDVRWLLWKFQEIEGFYPEGFPIKQYVENVRVTLASTEVKNTEQIQAIAMMIDMFNVAAQDGSLTATALNKPKYANRLAELLRVEDDIILPEEDIEANMQAMAQAQQETEMAKQRAQLAREVAVEAYKNKVNAGEGLPQ
ncbi:MAG: hypothetical protein IKA10_04485 [Oscillospiraceae bacterium]|nr:hypothetical protein [Oscillospiraceae bacterium]